MLADREIWWDRCSVLMREERKGKKPYTHPWFSVLALALTP